MADRLNISHSADSIAVALHRALKATLVARIGIDEVRAATIGYLAAGPHVLTTYDTETLVEATLRQVVEKVG